MDKYNVQNGRWRETEQEITTIKRVIYTQNKKWKKEYKGGKITSISTTSNKEPEKKKIKINTPTENKKQETIEVECVLFNKQHKPRDIKNKKEEPAVKIATIQPTRRPRHFKSTQTTNTSCSNCNKLYNELQEEIFQHHLANGQIDFWKDLQKTTGDELQKYLKIAKKIKRTPKE